MMKNTSTIFDVSSARRLTGGGNCNGYMKMVHIETLGLNPAAGTLSTSHATRGGTLRKIGWHPIS